MLFLTLVRDKGLVSTIYKPSHPNSRQVPESGIGATMYKIILSNNALNKNGKHSLPRRMDRYSVISWPMTIVQ